MSFFVCNLQVVNYFIAKITNQSPDVNSVEWNQIFDEFWRQNCFETESDEPNDSSVFYFNSIESHIFLEGTTKTGVDPIKEV